MCSSDLDIREFGHGLVIMVTKIMCEKEVAILVVIIDIDLEVCHLNASFRRDGFRLGVLLCQQRIDTQFTELQFGLDPEEGCAAAYERIIGVEVDVSGFDVFDDFVLIFTSSLSSSSRAAGKPF